MKVEGILNHAISHSLNHVTNLKFSFPKMSFSNKDVINVWQIENLTTNHIHMEDDKHSWMGAIF
jgi:hypothetical protein